MNNKFIAVAIIILVLLGGFLIYRNVGVAPTEINVENNNSSAGGTSEETDLPDNNTSSLPTTPPPPPPPPPTGAPVTVKEFSVDATSFSFTPSTMTVNKGDTVKITVKNLKGTHDLKIDAFNAGTRTLQAGESQTITFVADKAGSFEYYCSIGNHRAMGMKGTLTVR